MAANNNQELSVLIDATTLRRLRSKDSWPRYLLGQRTAYGHQLSLATDSLEPSPCAAKCSDAHARQRCGVHPLRAYIDIFAAAVVPVLDVALCALPETDFPLKAEKLGKARR